ncbi:sensor histidine kinase [Mycobacterium sp. URHB0021]
MLTRHLTNALASVTVLLAPTSSAGPAGIWLVAVLGGWATYRLTTRSSRGILLAVDCAFVLAVCAAAPSLAVSGPSAQGLSVQFVVATTTVMGLAVVLTPPISVTTTALILVAYACGSAPLVGWESVAGGVSLRYLAMAAAMGLLLRLTLLRVAAVNRSARQDCSRADDIRRRAAADVRNYRDEQRALLHDTVASTLLLVGNGTPIPTDRLAAQASNALDILDRRRCMAPPRRIELVSALREVACGTCTPVRFEGASELWLDGEVGTAIAAATREVMNNVDRHAHATHIRIDISGDRMMVSDNGCGFTPGVLTGTHGITNSIVGRVKRVGGSVAIRSAPGQGTAVTFTWPGNRPGGEPPASAPDAESLVKAIHERYTYTLIGWALIVIVLTLPYWLVQQSHPHVQLALAAVSALACLCAVPTLRESTSALRWIGISALLAVTVLQPAVLSLGRVSAAAEWSLWVTGWCLTPLLLGLPLRCAFAVIGANSAGAFAVTLARAPSAETAVMLGFWAASLAVLLVAAQMADLMFADAVTDTQLQTTARLDMLAHQRIAADADDEFRRGVADIRRNAVPLLAALTRGEPVDPILRHRARIESLRIRAFLDYQSTSEHPLLRAIRPALEAATYRGVEVSVHVQSDAPAPDEDGVERLVLSISDILENSTEGFRMVLTTAESDLVVSLVARGCESDMTSMDGDEEVVRRGDTLWVTIRRRVTDTTLENA